MLTAESKGSMNTDIEISSQSTIKDIARLAGVSIATVDRVLHDRGKVSKKNLDAVNKAIETLNYKPNQIARALSSRRGNLKIGLVIPKVESDFWGEFIVGVEQAQKQLAPFGVELVPDYTCNYDLDDQITSIQRVIYNDVQGLIIVPMYDGFGNAIESHIPENIPFCTIINDLPKSRQLFHIGPDDFGLGSLAARMTDLYCKGSGNVVILAPNHALIETQNRISGYVSKINQDKLDLRLLRIIPVPGKTEDAMYRNVYECTKECIHDCPDIDAFYVTNGLTEWCADAVAEYEGEKKFTIIGHEITSKTSEYLERGFIQSVIYQQPASQIIRAINIMYEYISGINTNPEKDIIAECNIIIKENLSFSNLGGQHPYGNS